MGLSDKFTSPYKNNSSPSYMEAISFGYQKLYDSAIESFGTSYHQLFMEHGLDILENLISNQTQNRARITVEPGLDLEEQLKTKLLLFDSVVFTPRLPGIRCGFPNPKPFDSSTPTSYFDMPSGHGPHISLCDDVEILAILFAFRPLIELGVCEYLPMIGNTHFWNHPSLGLPEVEKPYKNGDVNQSVDYEKVYIDASSQFILDTCVSDKINCVHFNTLFDSRNEGSKKLFRDSLDNEKAMAFACLHLKAPILNNISVHELSLLLKDYTPELSEFRRSLRTAIETAVDTNPSEENLHKVVLQIQNDLIDVPYREIERKLKKITRNFFAKQAVNISALATVPISLLLGTPLPPEANKVIGGASLYKFASEYINFRTDKKQLIDNIIYILNKG